jgi:uncharacterized radical SAM protein YgiQ
LKRKKEDRFADYPLPVSAAEMHYRGWQEIDVLIVTGDSYIDHPFIEAALVGRVLEKEGFRVALLPQPDWKSAEAFAALGKPKLFYLITAGNADSMAANYLPNRARAKEDFFSRRGAVGLRPDRASIVYAFRAREASRDVPVILFGQEASLRRLSHYDYWEEKVRRPVLFDAKADMVLYGPPEKTTAELARRVRDGEKVSEIGDLPGTAFKRKKISAEHLELEPFEAVSRCRRTFLSAFARYAENYFAARPLPVAQQVADWHLVVNPPAPPLDTATVDSFYDLPYTRAPHPLYEGEAIPAAAVLADTIVAVRGCSAPPLVCPSAFHYRSLMEARGLESIKKEAALISARPGFSGHLSIVGGYAARKEGFLHDSEKEPEGCWSRRKWPRREGHLISSLELRETLEEIERVESVEFYGAYNPDSLAGAPVRSAATAGVQAVNFPLKKESKPPAELYLAFASCCETRFLGRRSEPFLIPSVMVGRPGVELADVVEMSLLLRKRRQRVDKVLEFLPFPLSLATTRHFTGLDPLTGEPIYVPARTTERRTQKAILKYYEPGNYERVRRALMAIRRKDLIGKGPEALIDYPTGSPEGAQRDRGGSTRTITLRRPPQRSDGPHSPFKKRW